MEGNNPATRRTTPYGRHRTRVRWRDTLYARASVFLLLGGGALVGALLALSFQLVDDSVERLLDERLDLARTVGGLLERRLLGDLDILASRVAPHVEAGGLDGDARDILAAEYPETIYKEGALILDPDGAVLLSLPARPDAVQAALDLSALAGRAAAAQGPVISTLVRIQPGDRPVLVAAQPIMDAAGTPRAFVAGVLQPAAADLLGELREIRTAAATELELVDAHGVVVASTSPPELYRTTNDHSDALQDAIVERRPFKGRCHSCHMEGEEERRDVDVMSFAPLSKLQLGLAVYQHEAAALAPAFDLREQLTMVTAVVALFIIFMGFAVHSVVRPVVRLTRAVDGLEAADPDKKLPAFGRDEVGTLARSLDHWRARMYAAMNALEDSRRVQREKADAYRQHLEALEEIAAQSSMGESVESILEVGLRYILEAVQLDIGALRLEWEDARFEVNTHLDPEVARQALDRAATLELDESTRRLTPAGTGRCAVDTVPASDMPLLEERDVGTLAVSSLIAPHGLRLQAAMASRVKRDEVDERWVHSLFYHLCMSSTSRILRDREAARQQRQERYLRGVLSAQEEERARIARDLHDTIAQDLAALRLDLERFGWQLKTKPAIEAVQGLEARTAGILRTTRAILLDLRLTVLDSMGFIATLQWHLERLQREQGIRGVLSIDGDERDLDYYLSIALLRIFQECLNNVVQHAEAEQVFVTLSFDDGAVGLEVQDDGRGFDTSRGRPEGSSSGLGLLGMRERARLLGGTIEIASGPDEGTTVTVTVPDRPTAQQPLEDPS